MTVRAVVFDIGGVLEITPDTGWQAKWEERLHLTLNELDERLKQMGINGSLGTCSEEEWQAGLREVTSIDQAQADEFMRDLWQWYLGELNAELAVFFAGLRPRYQTALLTTALSARGAKKRNVIASTR